MGKPRKSVGGSKQLPRLAFTGVSSGSFGLHSESAEQGLVFASQQDMGLDVQKSSAQFEWNSGQKTKRRSPGQAIRYNLNYNANDNCRKSCKIVPLPEAF